MGAVKLFLKVERRAGAGCSSCTQIPTSLRLAEAGVLADDDVDAMKCSESMRSGE